MKYILSENQLTNLLKRITGSKRNEPAIEVVKNEIENLEGKTVRLITYRKGKKYHESSYQILSPKYQVIDTGKKLRGLISFNIKDLELSPSSYSNDNREYVMVDLKDGKVFIYGWDSDGKILTYKNESLEKYFEGLLDKFPLYWKDKEKIETDF